MDRLQGKVAIVTGGALGIGAACARRMAGEGCAVAITDVLDDPGERLSAELRDAGHRAAYFRCNVASEAEVAAVTARVVADFGRLDILVNNAGIAGPDRPTHELSEAEWDRVQAVNVKGVFFATKHAIAHLRRAAPAAAASSTCRPSTAWSAAPTCRLTTPRREQCD